MIDFEKKGWYPQPGEVVYLSHAITKGRSIRTVFNCFTFDGCLIVTTPTHKLYRIHPRHAGMKPIITIKEQQASSQTTITCKS